MRSTPDHSTVAEPSMYNIHVFLLGGSSLVMVEFVVIEEDSGKVKVIRDTMNQASEMWMTIIDEEDLWSPQLSIGDYKLDGFLFKSGYGSGRYMSYRQFFFVNGRPVDMPMSALFCHCFILKQKEVPAGSMPEGNDTCSEIIGSEELNSAMKDMDDVDHAGSMPGGNDIGILDLDSG
ncbi:hypothetical protein AgCh_017610 [Apium graveolens]